MRSFLNSEIGRPCRLQKPVARRMRILKTAETKNEGGSHWLKTCDDDSKI